MANYFNLIDEPWITVADEGKVSLKALFNNNGYRSLGGSPVQKISMMKLLLAIAQAACTPKDDKDWKQLGSQGMTIRCLDYLDKWHDRFYLYGDKPFLQIPAIKAAAKQSFGAVLPEVSTGNTTVLTQSQVEQPLADADKALLLVFLMAFALGGKKTDNKIVLADGYRGKFNDKGKPSTGKPGPAIAHMGLLHNFCLGKFVQQTLWLNLLTRTDIQSCGYYPIGIGTAPWQDMPVSEDCETARSLKNSLMGRLVPLSRFCLLADDGLHYSEGIVHASYLESVVDPTVSVNFNLTKPKVLWVNPEKRPWRELIALLGFFQQQSSGFNCLQLKLSTARAAHNVESFAIWSGGLKVSSNAGEQYVSGSNDIVESVTWLSSSALGESWFQQLKTEMEGMEIVSKTLYGCTAAFYKQQLKDGSDRAAQSTGQYWQFCERDIQSLVDSCDDLNNPDVSSQQRHLLRCRFADYAQRAYDRFCPKQTARQIDAWAKCRPNFTKYLKKQEVL